MKNLLIRRIFLSVSGTIAAALSVWLAQKEIPNEIAGALIGLLNILGLWGLSKWQGKPVQEIQEMVFPELAPKLKANGLGGDLTVAAVREAINDPHFRVTNPPVLKAKAVLKSKI